MPIPKYEVVMLPLLKLIATHGKLNRREAVELVADEFKLTDSERKELLPSGGETVIANRAG